MNDDQVTTNHAAAVRAALGWMVVSSMLFASVMVSVRFFLSDLPSVQTAFLRYVMGVFLLLPFVAGSLPQLWRSPVRKALASRGILHGIAVCLWFFSIQRIPLADVNAILNLGPVWATLGAAVFLGEKLRLRRVSAILISFAGAMIIIKPGFAQIDIGIMAVMCTAAFFAFSDLIAKQLKAHHDDRFIILSLSVTISLITLVPALFVWQPISAGNWVGIILIGTAATVGHVTLLRSFAGPMWAAQSGKYIQLLFVIILGVALFDEIPTTSTLFGALVVLLGVSYIAVREGRQRAGKSDLHEHDDDARGKGNG
jgi:drug/metabolite transporter (DMT)-like permease